MKIRIKPVLTAVFVTVVAASLLSVLRGAEYLFLVAGAALIQYNAFRFLSEFVVVQVVDGKRRSLGGKHFQPVNA
ncbi:MAG: hypothetical protein IJQ80_04890, partial [Clostridia bacterium]|nr:hypothetical protein [Clostridia bacterium]